MARPADRLLGTPQTAQEGTDEIIRSQQVRDRLFSLLKPYLRVFRGLSKTNLPGYLGFFQFLRNYRQQNAFEQAELILYAALDPAVASRARKGEFVKCFDHFDLLQTAIN